jgi:hypothetical protein
MKRLAPFAFIFAGLAACEAPPSAPTPRGPSVAAPTFALISNSRRTIPFTFTNTCPPAEQIVAAGDIHIVVTGDADQQKMHINWSNFHGVGAVTGAEYTGQIIVKRETDLPPPNTTVDATQRIRWMRHGSLDDFHLILVTRTTIPPGTVEVIRTEVDCRG